MKNPLRPKKLINLAILAAVVSVAFFAVFGAVWAQEYVLWSGPTAPPPGNNVNGLIFNRDYSLPIQAASINIDGGVYAAAFCLQMADPKTNIPPYCISNWGDIISKAGDYWVLDDTGTNLYIKESSWLVGIGTDAPAVKLEVSDGTDGTAQIRIADTAQNPELQLQYGDVATNPDDHWAIYSDQGSNDSLRIWSNNGGGTNAGNRLTILQNGNVGIGTTAPLSQLEISSDAGGIQRGLTVSQHNDASGSALMFFNKSKGTAASPAIVGAADIVGAIWSRPYDGANYVITAGVGFAINPGATTLGAGNMPTDIVFTANPTGGSVGLTTPGAEKMRITSIGNVGIGTATPIQKLQVMGDISLDPAAFYNIMNVNALQGLASGDLKIQSNLGVEDNKILYGALEHQFWTNHAQRLTIDSAGNVGIGATDPGQKLDIAGALRLDGLTSAPAVLTPLTGGVIYYDLPAKKFKCYEDEIKAWVDCIGAGTGTGLPAGTLGQTLRHDGASWVANSFLYNDGTKIGIGTAAPKLPLHVFKGSAGTYPAWAAADVALFENAVGQNTVVQLFTDNAKAGVLQFSFPAKRNAAQIYYNYAKGIMGFQNNKGPSDITAIAIESTAGNVGIGTTNPQNKLDIEGGAAIGADYSGTNAAPTNGLLVEGNVGIGTPAPDVKLVVGNGTAAGGNLVGINGPAADWLGYRISVGGAEKWFSGRDDSGNFVIRRDSAVNDVAINPNTGNVGLGLAPEAAAKLTVGGQVKITGGSPAADKVLAAVDAAGLAVWKSLGDLGGIGGDHGALTGLADDDHIQYLLIDGSRAMAGNLSMAPAGSENDIININRLIGNNDLFIKGNGPETAPIYYGASEHQFWTNHAQRLTIDSAGNVGIGMTPEAAAKLTVGGQVKITGGSPDLNKILVSSDTAGLAVWKSLGDLGGGGGNITGNGTENYVAKFGAGGETIVDSSIFNNNAGDVGIGQLAPSAKFHVLDTARNYQITAQGSSAAANKSAGYNLQIDSNNLWQLIADNADLNKFFIQYNSAGAGRYLTVQTNGQVGLGTPAPNVKLEVKDSIAGLPAAQIRITDTVDNPELQLQYSETNADDHWGIYDRQSDDSLNIWSNNGGGANAGDRLTILQNGNVGIGTASPEKALHIYKASNTENAEIDINSKLADNTGPTKWGIYQERADDPATASRGTGEPGDPVVPAYNEAGDLRFWNNNVPAPGDKNVLTISDDGKVGIGLTAPNNLLQVKGLANFSDETWGLYLGRDAFKNSTIIYEQQFNTGIGFRAGYNNTTLAKTWNPSYPNGDGTFGAWIVPSQGRWNTYIGSFAGYGGSAPGGSGWQNVAVGTYALQSITTGVKNVAIGVSALYRNTTGGSNIAIGSGEPEEPAGGNIAVGGGALMNNKTGNWNVAIGGHAANENILSDYNVALGVNAYRYNEGARNIAIGNHADGAGWYYNWNINVMGRTDGNTFTLPPTNSRVKNTIIGDMAGYNLTAGSNNVFFGYHAGYNQTTGSNLLIIDNQVRGAIGAPEESTKSLIYGEFAALPANQKLTFNANVGIGGAPSTEKLYVGGDIKASGSICNGAGQCLGAGGGGISGTTDYVPKFATASTLGNSQIFDNGVGVGIGTAMPKSKLDVAGGMTIGASWAGSFSTPANSLVVEGKVGIGTTDPGTYKLNVNGDAFAASWHTPAGDYAEWFEKEETAKPGDLVGLNLKTGQARKYRAGDKFIGIQSANPAFVGNRTKETEEEMAKTHILVGLLGQLEFDKSQTIIKDRLVLTKDGQEVGVLLANGKVLLGR